MSQTSNNFLQNICCLLYRISTFRLEKGGHPSRFFMYRHLQEFAEPRDPDARVLSISHSEHLASIIGYHDSQIEDASFPEYTIADLPFENDRFDAVVTDQVLEHVAEGPFLAMQESFRVVKPGGLVVHATVFTYPIHGCPNDYWRFTPQALEALVKPYGKVIESGGWGNGWISLLWALGLRWEPMPTARWHPANMIVTMNDKERPIVVWVIAQKE